MEQCFGVNPDEVASYEAFDIPLGITTALSEPVSIKSTKGRGLTARVYLSDASRIWSWHTKVRLIVGLWTQEPGKKRFHTVWDLELTLHEIAKTKLFGSVTYEEISAFHKGLLARKDTPFAEAHAWAYSTRASLEPRLGVIHLDPKLDHKRQRRLQCSAILEDLAGAASRANRYIEGESFRGLVLPFYVRSTPRERNRKSLIASS